MMYNIHTGRGVPQRQNDEIIILVAELRQIQARGYAFLFTDRHAYMPMAVYYDDLNRLSEIDWPLLQQRDFRRNPDDPLQIERYQAEALIHKHLPADALLGIICYTDTIKSTIETKLNTTGINLDVQTMRGWYF